MIQNPTLRYELKVVCKAHWRSQAGSWIRLHPAGLIVAYPPRWVNSLYLDTPRMDGLSANLEGFCTRSKLRWRWYGDDLAIIRPYLEIKQKHNLLSVKRRCRLPCQLDMTRPWNELIRTVYDNVGPDWQTRLQAANRPSLLTRYQREYYVTPDGGVRVTLDYAQSACDQRFSPRPNLCVRLPIADVVVIEVKAGRDQADRAQEIVSHFPVPRSSNSKYATGMLTALYSQ